MVDVTSTSVGSNEEKIFLFMDMKRSINIYCQCNMQERFDNIQTKRLGPRNPARDGWVSVRENGVCFFLRIRWALFESRLSRLDELILLEVEGKSVFLIEKANCFSPFFW